MKSKKKKPHGYWTLERCQKSAQRFETKADWSRGESSAYSTAKQKGWMGDCCAHMLSRSEAHTRANTKWDLEACRADALKHQTRKSWERANPPAYRRARIEGFLEKCCAHMQADKNTTDANVVYIWQNMDDERGSYKVGITSNRIAEERIAICSRKNSMNHSVILMLKCDNARDAERELLDMGRGAGYPSAVDGYTEFRILNDAELGEAVTACYRISLAA